MESIGMTKRLKKIIYVCSIAVVFLQISTFLTFGDEEKEQVKEVFNYNDHGMRDPFWPLVTSGGVVVNHDTELLFTDLVLEGTMMNPDGSNVAIINGRIVKVNQTIGDFTVLKIDQNVVVVLKEQDTYELRLKKEE